MRRTAPFLAIALLAPAAAAQRAPEFSSSETAIANTRAALKRIKALNPRVNAVIAVDPTAIDQARRLDRIRRARGPLFGMPILIKDNIETAGPAADHRRQPGAGRQRHQPRRAAGRPARAGRGGDRRQGQSVANGPTSASNDSISGWSAVGGQTRNPHALNRNACGSSTGSGVGGRGRDGAGGDRHRDRRLDHLPGRDQRDRRLQADGRAWSAGPMSSRSATARTRPGR